MATGHKTGGRQAGTPNRLTLELKSVLKDVLDQEIQHLPERLDTLTAKERIDLVIRLLPFVLPKVEQASYKIGEPCEGWDDLTVYR
jgi:hypothetical protein